jgi:hypothetical protein
MRSRLPLFLTTTIAAACLAFAGPASASIPGPDGVIHGCYAGGPSLTSPLSVIDSLASCPTGTTALNWNQTAAPAPTTGAVDAIDFTRRLYVMSPGSLPSPTKLSIPVKLPDGAWAVTAHLQMDGDVTCGLVSPLTTTDNATDGFSYDSEDRRSQLTFTSVVTSGADGQPSLECQNPQPYFQVVQVVSIVALRVNLLAVKTPGGTFKTPAPALSLRLKLPHRNDLIKAYYSPRSSATTRQRAQIALLADQGEDIGEIAHDTFADPAEIRSVVRANGGIVRM